MFIDTEKVTSTWVKESPATTTIEEFKKNAAIKEYKILLFWVEEEPSKIGQKKRARFAKSLIGDQIILNY